MQAAVRGTLQNKTDVVWTNAAHDNASSSMQNLTQQKKGKRQNLLLPDLT
jgi:hypothetical protein